MRVAVRVLGLIAAAVLPVTALVAAPAQAAPKSPYRDPQIAYVNHARIKGDHVNVRAKYRCWGGNNGTHVWVSLKQGPKINALSAKKLANMEGTSALAKAWYDTNNTDPQKVFIVCNGNWQKQLFRLTKQKGTIKKGRAFLQFCLFDSHSDPTGQDLSKGFAYEYKKITIKKAH